MTDKQQSLLRKFAFVDKIKHEAGATPEENERFLPYGVKVIIYVACAHSAMYDLQEELRNLGVYRHHIKRYISKATEEIGYVHNALYKGIGAYNGEFGRWYNEQFGNADIAIQSHVELKGAERAYNIAIALMRLAIVANGKCGRFMCPAIANVVRAMRYIERCELPLRDYSIDKIIETGAPIDEMVRLCRETKFKKD